MPRLSFAAAFGRKLAGLFDEMKFILERTGERPDVPVPSEVVLEGGLREWTYERGGLFDLKITGQFSTATQFDADKGGLQALANQSRGSIEAIELVSTLSGRSVISLDGLSLDPPDVVLSVVNNEDGAGLARLLLGLEDLRIDGTRANDRFDRSLLSAFDRLDLSGDNRINLRAGNDAARAGAGRDTVFGGSGRDTIHGGSGRDRLDGGRWQRPDGRRCRKRCAEGWGRGRYFHPARRGWTRCRYRFRDRGRCDRGHRETGCVARTACDRHASVHRAGKHPAARD